MIIAIDIETQGLDATKFILGTIYNGKTHKTFKNKEEMWQHILEQGKTAKKAKQTLRVYGHNIQYDFYGIANIKDKSLKIYNHNPFIAIYKNQENTIYFLDTMSIYKMSLAKAAQIIGEEKKEMPKTLMKEEGQTYTEIELRDIEQYCKHDTYITYQLINKIKKQLKQDKINIRFINTISQIAIQYLLKEIAKQEPEGFFYNKERLMINYTRKQEKTREAYRGGYLTPFKTGTYQKTTYIDCNNLYGYATTQIQFPNLKKEKYIQQPQKYYTTQEIIQKTGVSRALIYNNSDEIPYLQIRTPDGNYTPKKRNIPIRNIHKPRTRIRHNTRI